MGKDLRGDAADEGGDEEGDTGGGLADSSGYSQEMPPAAVSFFGIQQTDFALCSSSRWCRYKDAIGSGSNAALDVLCNFAVCTLQSVERAQTLRFNDVHLCSPPIQVHINTRAGSSRRPWRHCRGC